jgi:single-strand DNA-binding protein
MSSFTINRVVLIGRLTKDPELRALPSGLAVCNLRVACNSVRRDTEGEYRDKPNYFDVSAFGGAAESVSRYTHKGSRVAIDGRLEWREWETSAQQRRQTVSVVADTVMFLDSPSERSGVDRPPDGEPSDGFGSEQNDGFGVQERDGFGGEELDPGSTGDLVGVGVGAEDDGLVF